MKSIHVLFTILLTTLITSTSSAQTDTAGIILAGQQSIVNDTLIIENDTVIISENVETTASLQREYSIVAHYDTTEVDYNFWLCTPPDYDSVDTQKKLPLIVHLHGASLCGYDLHRARRYGPVDALRYGRQINAVILNPQNPRGPWKPEKINRLVDWTIQNCNIDTTRIYVLGMSLGGYGTMDYCATYPERVAAGMALCGGITTDASGLSRLPFWIIHGTSDRAVPIKCSKDVVQKLQDQQLDSLLKFTWIKYASHGALARLFYMPKTYEWLYSHSLTDSVRTINRDCEFTLDEIKKAYTGINKNANILKITDNNPQPNKYPSWYDGIDYSKAEIYVVKKGDVLVNIAKKTHTSVDQICRLNHISRTTTLQIGQKLKIKAK